ncbi:unnamed protein product [Anisakis simplex]|uniref:Uncharacterized protein n=1 Tax=Anisakis simplex TaxID=6269 RepID=A0A0M3J9E6_ANISI|nr:unnamed protein product [Anisakis simplex]
MNSYVPVSDSARAVRSSTRLWGNRKHRPVLTARSDTALSEMRICSLTGLLDVISKQEVSSDGYRGYTISETIELRANGSKAEPVEVGNDSHNIC